MSVLPILSQVFDRVIKARLVGFLDANKVLIPGQYGFRSGHSTAMAVLDMVEKIRKAWFQKKVALGVFLDLKKAFDTVDHKILLAKLDHYGVRGQTLELMRSYLDGRSQYVSYAASQSKRGPVECGVPQGSVLGPLFFLLYVNDMVKACGDLELILFADNTNVFAEASNPSELFKRVNKGLKVLSICFKCNKLTLNLKKTEFINFGGPGQAAVPREVIRIGDEPIRQVQGVRFLGVWIDEGLKWTAYIEKIKNKVNQLLGVIGRVRTSLGGRAILSQYNGLVLPHLQYCLIVWGDFQGDRNKTGSGDLLRLQKRFVGMAAGATSRYHADPLFARYGMLKLEDLYRQQLRIHGWQFWNGH